MAAFLLLFYALLCATPEAVRLEVDLDEFFKMGATEAATKPGALLEKACEMDGGATTSMDSERNTAANLTLDVDPGDYWKAEKALERCRKGGIMRVAKVMLGMPAMVMGTQFMVMSVTGSHFLQNLLATTFSAIEVVTLRPAAHIGAFVMGNVFTPLFQIVLKVPLHFAKGVLLTVLGSVTASFFVGGFLIAVSPLTAVGLVPIVGAMVGSERVTSWTVDLAARLLGYGAQVPRCCCLPNAGGNGTAAAAAAAAEEGNYCALVSSSSAGGESCPQGWVHNADECAVPEAITYSEEQTVLGCTCRDFLDCATNEPHRGHAWCEVAAADGAEGDGRKCGTVYASDWKRRWDFCRFGGKPLEFATGSSTEPNDALATFIPNRFSGIQYVESRISGVFTLGTWVDEAEGLVARTGARLSGGSQCFAGTQVETLGGCAKLCATEGAPDAKRMSRGARTGLLHDCVAFAYNRLTHLCVRLPALAVNADFRPHLASWAGEGWQNFVSKYHGRDQGKSCSAAVMQSIQDSGFAIVQEKSRGHLYVQCANTEVVQQASCVKRECGSNMEWCLVQNGCRSGLLGLFKRCRRISEEEALTCAGEHGEPPKEEKEGNYWAEANIDKRCQLAGRARLAKAAVAVPLLLMGGEVLTMSLLNQGIYLRSITNVFANTALPYFTEFFKLTGGLANVAGTISSALPKLFLIQGIWGILLGQLSVVWMVGGSMLGLTPTVATILAPILAVMEASVRVAEITVSQAARFLGVNTKFPRCCCLTTNRTTGSELMRGCGLMAPSDAKDEAECFPGWEHDATACEVAEVVQYSNATTVRGCSCSSSAACASNPPFRGHAWCAVNGKCGHRGLRTGRWDYCRMEGNALEYFEGQSKDTSDALATFIPNVYTRLDLFGPGHPLRLGTWTDSDRALTTARPASFKERQCFAATPVETLGACAKACLDEGARSAPGEIHQCYAFAYNRAQGLCVRLPSFAADARYTPTLGRWGGSGWQNFVSKYFGRNLQASCPAMTLLAIRDAGYAVAKDQNDGRLWLRCMNGTETSKASCLKKDCKAGEWCFVRKRCIFGRCRRAAEEKPLPCGQPSAA